MLFGGIRINFFFNSCKMTINRAIGIRKGEGRKNINKNVNGLVVSVVSVVCACSQWCVQYFSCNIKNKEKEGGNKKEIAREWLQ